MGLLHTAKTSLLLLAVIVTGACSGSEPAPSVTGPINTPPVSAKNTKVSSCPAGPVTAPAPPDSFRIEYLGEKSINAVIPGAKAGDHLSPQKVLHTWHETARNFYVGMDPDAGWGLEELKWLWHALAKIEANYKHLYEALFLKSGNDAKHFLSNPAGDPWTNINIVPLFIVIAKGFQAPDKQAIASNYYYLGPSQGRAYSNVPFVGLNPAVIDGEVNGLGPGPIYPGCGAAEARLAYLREGLLDTILHERVHGFISQFFAHDSLFAELRPNGPQPKCEYDLEELLVKRYVMRRYELQAASFSKQFFEYWKADEDVLFDSVKNSACYTRLANRGLLEKEVLATP